MTERLSAEELEHAIHTYRRAAEKVTAERDALAARVEALEAMVGELADDVEAAVENEWNPDRRGVHPANATRYERDMGLPRRARALLTTESTETSHD